MVLYVFCELSYFTNAGVLWVCLNADIIELWNTVCEHLSSFSHVSRIHFKIYIYINILLYVMVK